MKEALSLKELSIISAMPNVINCSEALFLVRQSNRYSVVRYSTIQKSWDMIYLFPTTIPTSKHFNAHW
jgi:hypothetical protein